MIRRKLAQLRLVLGDPRWWRFYIQRQVMNPIARDRLARFVARTRPTATPVSSALTDCEATNALRTSGIAMLGKLLDRRQCDEILAYFRQQCVHDPYRVDGKRYLPESEERHADSHVAYHLAEDVVRAPHLLALANDQRILAVVSEFLGCKPTIGYLTAWWSYRTNKGAQQAELFHRDVDDWKFVKLFVYLTDVDEKTGPHVYVRHSAHSAKLNEIRRFTDEEVRAAFGQNNVVSITAKAGHGFLEDTFGIHKGRPVTERRRLIFQAVYGLSHLPYGPKKPVLPRLAVAGMDIDLWVNRAYIG